VEIVKGTHDPYIGLPGYGHCHHLAGTKMSSLDYSIFAAPDFNPNEYASSILSSEPGSDSKSNSKSSAHLKGFGQDSVTKDDISVAISKLSFGIEDVSKQIRHLVLYSSPFPVYPINSKVEVTAHHEELLIQASNANALSGTLVSVRAGLNDLENSVEKYEFFIILE